MRNNNISLSTKKIRTNMYHDLELQDGAS